MHGMRRRQPALYFVQRHRTQNRGESQRAEQHGRRQAIGLLARSQRRHGSRQGRPLSGVNAACVQVAQHLVDQAHRTNPSI
jgi:hypothetical protein